MADVRPQQAPVEGEHGEQGAWASAGGPTPAEASGAETCESAEGGAPAGAWARAVTAGRGVWGGSELSVARAMLAHYYAHGWLACEALLAAALAILMFWSAEDAAYVFGSASVGLGLLGVIFAAVLAHGALSPQVRAPLVRAHGPGAYLRGLLLAAGLVRAGMCVLVMALALALGRISDAAAGNVLAGTTGLIALCVLLAALVIVVSSPLTSRGERLALLAGLDGALYSLAGTGWSASVLSVLRLPLLPLILCYEASITGELSWRWLSALLLAGVYVVALGWLGERLLARAMRAEHAGTVDSDQGAEAASS